jgi:hypothetical protein
MPCGSVEAVRADVLSPCSTSPATLPWQRGSFLPSHARPGEPDGVLVPMGPRPALSRVDAHGSDWPRASTAGDAPGLRLTRLPYA